MNTFDAKKLAACAIAQSDDPTRYYICGVFLEGKIAVATDGHLMTVAHDSEAVIDEPGIYPVSKKALTAMKHKNAHLVRIAGDVLTVHTIEDAVLHMEPCKPIDGTFPDWRRVACVSFKHGATHTPACFMSPVLDALSATSKIFNKIGGYTMFGAESNAAHFVAYNYAPEVYSVAMPARGVTAMQSAPHWAAYPADSADTSAK